MYLSTPLYIYIYICLYLEGTLYKFATNSQISSYSKLHLRQVHHIFLFQRKSINGANYICTECTREACWLRMDPVCSPNITLPCMRACSEEKYHVLAFTFKTVIHTQQMFKGKEEILKVGRNTGRKSIYIAQFQDVYIGFFFLQ